MYYSFEKGKKRKCFYICFVLFILGYDERGGCCVDWCCEIFLC